MKRMAWSLGVLFVGVAIAAAQPPEGPRGGGRGGDFRPPPNPVVEALDADGDGVISADEIKNAAESLAKLDTNKDGKLTDEETRPRPPAGGRGPGDRGPADRGAGDRAAGGQAGNRARGAEGRGAAGRNGDARGPEGRPGAGRDAEPNGPGGGRGPGGPEGQGGPGGPGGPPNPERFLEHAMQFDADNDGKLNKDELAKFAVDMAQRRGGPGGPGGPEGRQGGGPGGGGGRPESGERPRRPD